MSKLKASPATPTPYEVQHVERAAKSRAFSFLAHAWVELLEAGYCDDDQCAFNWDSPLFFIEIEAEIVGALVYRVTDWNRELFIKLGYVHPSHRGKGLYRALYEAAVAKARELKMLTVTGCVDTRNTEMQKVAEALGRKPVYIGYVQELGE